MKIYSLGFMFNNKLDSVLLISKKRPPWQYGRLNGVGGHVDRTETPFQSMVREFYEEVGIKTEVSDWKYYCLLKVQNHRCGEDARVHVFTSIGPIHKALRKTDESPLTTPINILHLHHTIDNLPWLIPMAINVLLDSQPKFVEVQYGRE